MAKLILITLIVFKIPVPFHKLVVKVRPREFVCSRDFRRFFFRIYFPLIWIQSGGATEPFSRIHLRFVCPGTFVSADLSLPTTAILRATLTLYSQNLFSWNIVGRFDKLSGLLAIFAVSKFMLRETIELWNISGDDNSSLPTDKINVQLVKSGKP